MLVYQRETFFLGWEGGEQPNLGHVSNLLTSAVGMSDTKIPNPGGSSSVTWINPQTLEVTVKKPGSHFECWRFTMNKMISIGSENAMPKAIPNKQKNKVSSDQNPCDIPLYWLVNDGILISWFMK